MYREDVFDPALIDARLAEFSDQIERRLAGELTEAEFEPLRLRNGLHLQPHSYMLCIAITQGTLNARQLRALAHVARVYDRGYVHFTSRGDVQFQWPSLSDIAAMLASLATVGLYARDADETRASRVHANATAGRLPDHASVPISLTGRGGPPGDISDDEMDTLADLTEHYGSGEIRVTGDQMLELPLAARADLKIVQDSLAAFGWQAFDANPLPEFEVEPLVPQNAATSTDPFIRNDHSERFLDVYRRVGPAPFKETLHGTASRIA